VALAGALVVILRDWLTHRLDAPPSKPLDEHGAGCPWLFPNVSRSNAWYTGEHKARPIARLQSVARRAGVEGITWHSLRRSLATHLEAHGTGQAMITRILRHADRETTKRHYQQADVRNMVEAVDGLDF
jgi:integrase